MHVWRIAALVLLFLLLSTSKRLVPRLRPMVDMEISQDLPVEEICARGLPVVFINTPKEVAITSKDIWTKKTTIQIVSPGDEAVSSPKKIWIKGHGNGTWRNYPKKSYTFKLKKPMGLLGMEKSYRYVLLANWRDRTLIRNAVAMKISSLTSLDWTPEGQFVELVFNGKMLGTYYLTEKPNIEKDNELEDLHVPVGLGGHLICLDTGGADADKDFTSALGTPVFVKHPLGEDLAEGEREEVFHAVDSIESMITGKSRGDWKMAIDMESFCDWYIVQELTVNIEARRPRSCYFHFKDDGILYAGPCWDYDYKTFIRRRTALIDGNAFWFKYLLEDEDFRRCLKERWEALEPSFRDEVPPYIDEVASHISDSEKLNHRMWPIVFWFDNHDEKKTYTQAVARLKKNYLRRVDELDSIFEGI